jgi:hypothetical protein
MPQLLAPANTQAQSEDFTVASGEESLLTLFDADSFDVPPCRVQVLKKSSSNTYTAMAELNEFNRSVVVAGVGTWAVLRLASTGAVGVDKD